MELEREKGITIQSAATYCEWGDFTSTSSHPATSTFTSSERALRVLHGAILVLSRCRSSVQSITVDRQMKR